jgi:hypothetical protein
MTIKDDEEEAEKLYEFLRYVYFVENIAQNEGYDTAKSFSPMASQEFYELREKLKTLDMSLDDKLSEFIDNL